jgi:hypothetical protein
MNDNKNNLIVEFCFIECKFRDIGCDKMPEINSLLYCPAEHFADWISKKLIQPDYRERTY